MATFAAPPWVPGLSHAHLSAFSAPLVSVQPPAGFWSVMVSEYSCPSTIVYPSRLPAVPELTKFWPQLVPRSIVYGMLVNAMSPTDEEAAPPVRVVSPFQSCHAHQPALALQPSGWKLCGDRITYCALRLDAG